MLPDTVWPGTDAEFAEWRAVLIRLMAQHDPDCGCKAAEVMDDYGHTMPGVTCPTHVEATQNQRWLNGLVMMRRRRFRLLYEEGVEP